MRFTLPESVQHPQERSRFVASAAAHVAILGLMLARPAWTAVRTEPAPEAIAVHYAELPRAASAMREVVAVTARAASSLPALPRFRAIDISIPLTNVPMAAIPAVGFLPQTMDSEAYPKRIDGQGLQAVTPGDQPLDARGVDKVVEPRTGNPVPRYPLALEAAGASGAVTVRFIVDTLGVVEKGSVEVLRSSHLLFAQSVREALARMRFLPAEAGGKRVRQLVEQTFRFEIRL